MKIILTFTIMILTLSLTSFEKNSNSIHSYSMKDIEGNIFDFASLKGKKIMIVNTASKCGLTPQYEQLETIYKKYKGNDFVIIGFPANNFGDQEPGTNDEIIEFCTKNYGVTFPMMEKVSVKGKDMCEVYKFLTKKSKNNFENSTVKWNFQKYLLDKDGHLVRVVSPTTKPDDTSIIEWIEK